MAPCEAPLLTGLPSNLYSVFLPRDPIPTDYNNWGCFQKPPEGKVEDGEEEAAPSLDGSAQELRHATGHRPRWAGRKEAGQRHTQRMGTEWRDRDRTGSRGGLWAGASERTSSIVIWGCADTDRRPMTDKPGPAWRMLEPLVMTTSAL